MKRLLITGGGGFLGSFLAREFSERYEVAVLGRGAAPGDGRWIDCDIREARQVERAIRGFAPQAIVHCAALSRIGDCEARPLECLVVNVQGSLNVAAAALEAGVELVLGISSDRVHQREQNLYGFSKSAMERIFVALGGAQRGTAFVSLRLGKLPGSPGGFLDHWKAAFARAGVISSTGPQQSSFFLSRAQCAQHIALLLEHGAGWSGQVYVPDQKAARLRDILEVWVDALGGSWRDDSDGSTAPESGVLISAAEAARTRESSCEGLVFRLIAASSVTNETAAGALDTSNAPCMTREEILSMLRDQGIGPLATDGDRRG